LIRLGRVPVPLLRRGDEEFQQLTWDDALKLVARRLGDGGRIEVGARAQSVEASWSLRQVQTTLRAGPALLTLGPVAGVDPASFRAHCLEFLDPVSVGVDGDEVLLLPVQSRYSQTGGSTWHEPDIVRFSPEIRGNPVAEARPDWEVLIALGRLMALDLPPIADADALRALIEAADERLRGLAELTTPGSRLHLGPSRGRRHL
jgi:anaerobic selenocysteine-containing dehydrogenase